MREILIILITLRTRRNRHPSPEPTPPISDTLSFMFRLVVSGFVAQVSRPVLLDHTGRETCATKRSTRHHQPDRESGTLVVRPLAVAAGQLQLLVGVPALVPERVGRVPMVEVKP